MLFKYFLLRFSVLFLMCIALKANAQTQLELNQTAADEYKKVDAKLNKTYTQLLSLLTSKSEKDLLIKAERNWIAFRDAQANFDQKQYDGGSMQPLVYFGSLRQVTETRIKQLEECIENRNH